VLFSFSHLQLCIQVLHKRQRERQSETEREIEEEGGRSKEGEKDLVQIICDSVGSEKLWGNHTSKFIYRE
jgi:hypothetical protein